jgi:mutator protein MutT
VKTTVVSAAVIERGGRLLVTRRLAGTHLAGTWEFPGGKCEAGEDCKACLVRELREELGVESAVGALILSTRHAYEDRTVELHFYACEIHGEPAALLGQGMRWVASSDLDALEFPPADAELIEILTRGKQPNQPRS